MERKDNGPNADLLRLASRLEDTGLGNRLELLSFQVKAAAFHVLLR